MDLVHGQRLILTPCLREHRVPGEKDAAGELRGSCLCSDLCGHNGIDPVSSWEGQLSHYERE